MYNVEQDITSHISIKYFPESTYSAADINYLIIFAVNSSVCVYIQ